MKSPGLPFASPFTSPLASSRHPLEQGMVILVALIVLVVMSIAAIALMRSVDTASLIAGNLAFRQGAAIGGDSGVEAARTALMTTITDLTADAAGAGYYSTIPDSSAIDLTGNRLSDKDTWVAWPDTDGAGQKPACMAQDSTTGNTVCYIIHRLCAAGTVELDPDTCFVFSGGTGGGDYTNTTGLTGGLTGGDLPSPPQGYYRITVRTAGPRNNVSFLQAFVVI